MTKKNDEYINALKLYVTKHNENLDMIIRFGTWDTSNQYFYSYYDRSVRWIEGQLEYIYNRNMHYETTDYKLTLKLPDNTKFGALDAHYKAFKKIDNKLNAIYQKMGAPRNFFEDIIRVCDVMDIKKIIIHEQYMLDSQLFAYKSVGAFRSQLEYIVKTFEEEYNQVVELQNQQSTPMLALPEPRLTM